MICFLKLPKGTEFLWVGLKNGNFNGLYSCLLNLEKKFCKQNLSSSRLSCQKIPTRPSRLCRELTGISVEVVQQVCILPEEL